MKGPGRTERLVPKIGGAALPGGATGLDPLQNEALELRLTLIGPGGDIGQAGTDMVRPDVGVGAEDLSAAGIQEQEGRGVVDAQFPAPVLGGNLAPIRGGERFRGPDVDPGEVEARQEFPRLLPRQALPVQFFTGLATGLLKTTRRGLPLAR